MDNRIILLLEDVCQHLEQSGRAYKEYLQNGCTFFYAKQLMEHNSAIQSALTKSMDILPDSLKNDAEQLVNHYKTWTEKWLALEKETSPSDDDVFIFQNNHTFPRKAAQKIEETFEKFKGKQ